MGIANIGGAASPQVIYGKNSTGAVLEPGDVVEINLVDGAGDGYEFTTPDIDLAKPESLFARCGVVVTADGPIEIEFQDGANIAVQVEGPISEVAVDGSSVPIEAGDLLIKEDGTSNLVKMQSTAFDVPTALTDSSGGTAGSTVVAVSGSGQDTEINNNFASLTDQVNDLRNNIAALVDSLKVVAVAREDSSSEEQISAQIVKV
jgi:hypothetical protein